MSYDLSSSKTFKDVIKPYEGEMIERIIEFKNDVEGQVTVTPIGRDLVITAYAQNKDHTVNYKKVLGTITIKNGAKEEYIAGNDIVFEGNIYEGDIYGYIANPVIYDFRDSSKAQTIQGSDFDEEFYGSSKADKIFTGGGDDTITAGQGDDIITIDGEDEKTIYFNKGDGNNIIGVGTYKDEDDDIEKYEIDDIELNFNPVDENDQITFSYEKSFQDLKIIATHSDGTKESATLKNYFDFNFLIADFDGDFDSVYLNGKDVDNRLSSAGSIKVNGIKVSEILKFKINDTMAINDIIKIYGLKIPAGLTAISAFVGTEYNDTFEGTTGKDVMLSLGGNNTFTTGTKGQTVILSANEEIGILNNQQQRPNDTYNVSSFAAGTVIIDQDSNFDMNIKGVDINDIHMLSFTNHMDTDTEEDGNNYNVTTKTLQVDYMTDSKGISNLAGIDYNGIYKKVKSTIQSLNTDGIKAINGINKLIGMVPGIIDKFRGVALATINKNEDTVAQNEFNYDDYDTEDRTYRPVTVYDSNNNEHVISAQSQETLDNLTTKSLLNFIDNVNNKYGLDLSDRDGNTNQILEEFALFIVMNPKYAIDKEEAEQTYPESILKSYYKYDKNNQEYVLNSKVYKEIKNDFFNTFKNLYLGTDSNNNYTIVQSREGVGIASGTGADTFTFKGDLVNKVVNGVNYEQSYDIVSNFAVDEQGNAQDRDTIKFTNYKVEENTLQFHSSKLTKAQDGSVRFNGLRLGVYDAKKNNFATVTYGIGNIYGSEDALAGFDVSENKFENLTITDSTNTEYEVTAEYNANSINYDWTDDGKNYVAITNSIKTSITSNSGFNTISADSFASSANDGASFTYTYGGGNDLIYSLNNYSNDTYNVSFDNNTTVVIYDKGGEDTLKITTENGNYDNVKLFFDVNNNGDCDDRILFVDSSALNKKGFTVSKYNNNGHIQYSAVANNCIDITRNEIENVSVGDYNIRLNSAINEIAQNVQGWLNSDANKKGYESAAEVLNRGSGKEINEVLAIYNNYELVPVNNNII